MRYEELTALLEEWYPLSFQEGWDRCGSVLPPAGELVSGVVVGLSLTRELVERACELGANVVVCHHPVFYEEEFPSCPDSLKSVELLSLLEDRGVGFYALHTNFDRLELNRVLALRLGLSDLVPLSDSLGVVGVLPCVVSFSSFLSSVKGVLGVEVLPFTRGLGDRLVRRVAVVGGSGRDFLDVAMERGDCFLTGDLSYHSFEKASYFGFPVADIGHHHGEVVGVEFLVGRLACVLPVGVFFHGGVDFREFL